MKKKKKKKTNHDWGEESLGRYLTVEWRDHSVCGTGVKAFMDLSALSKTHIAVHAKQRTPMHTDKAQTKPGGLGIRMGHQVSQSIEDMKSVTSLKGQRQGLKIASETIVKLVTVKLR